MSMQELQHVMNTISTSAEILKGSHRKPNFCKDSGLASADMGVCLTQLGSFVAVLRTMSMTQPDQCLLILCILTKAKESLTLITTAVTERSEQK